MEDRNGEKGRRIEVINRIEGKGLREGRRTNKK